VNDYCLTPNEPILKLYHVENKLHLMRWW